MSIAVQVALVMVVLLVLLLAAGVPIGVGIGLSSAVSMICTINGWKTVRMKVCVLLLARSRENSRCTWISMKNTMVPMVWWQVLQEVESQRHCRPIF